MSTPHDDKMTPVSRAAASEKMERTRRQKELFQRVKEMELSKYEDHDSEASILKSIQLSSLLLDSSVGRTIVNTKEEELPGVFSQILRMLVKKRKEKNQLVDSKGFTDLRGELQGTAASGTVQVCPATADCCEDYEPSTGESSDDQTDIGEAQWEAEDKILPSSSRREVRGSFMAKYPNLPGIKCPRNLFVSTLSPGYINSLYYTNNEAFPRQWDKLKKKDPIQAWSSLNQTIIPYMNERWGGQGVKIEDSETAVDCYNVNALKSALVETVEKALSGNLINQKDTSTVHPSHDHQMRELTSKMEDMSVRLNEWRRVVTSDIVKRTQTEMNPKPLVSMPDPSISISSYQPSTFEIESLREYKYQEEEIW